MTKYQFPSYMMQAGTPFEIPDIDGAKIVSDGALLGGRQVVVKFANGYSASVVNHFGAYGGLELAVLDRSGQITYDTPITDDVIGYLTQEALNETLAAINANGLRVTDDLAPMRGLIFGVLFSLAIWAVVIGLTAAVGYGIAWAVTK